MIKFTCLALGLLGVAGSANAEDTRASNPNLIGLEVFGRGLLYSIVYDRVMSENFAAGFGIGTVGANFPGGASSGNSATLIPIYMNYYFSQDQSSLFLTLGADLITNGSSVQNLQSSIGNVTFPTSSVLPTFGLGYENRTDSGFLFRMAAYGVYGTAISPWFGGSFGYAF